MMRADRDRWRGLGLIEVLVVAVLLIALAAFLLPRYLGGRAGGKVVRAPITVARDAVCRTDLNSVRQSIQAAAAGDPDGRPVGSLDELRELTPDLKRCPVGGEPYVYDPRTGQVRCPHPGHESY